MWLGARFSVHAIVYL